MVAYNFQAQFVPSIESRQKRQTIRANRKRHARPGEAVQLYTGMRTKNCRKLVTPDPVCIKITPIRIEQGIFNLSDRVLTSDELLKMAVADGFNSVTDFLSFFSKTHGLPFEGVLICWEAV